MTRFALFMAAVLLASPLSAQTLDRILERGEIRLGHRVDAPPLSYIDGAGLPAGFSIRICRELARAAGNVLEIEDLTVTFVEVTTANRFDMVANGDIDLLCGAASITMSRRAIVDFSIPTFMDGTAVLLPDGASTNMGTLAGQSVGVRANTTTADALNNTLSATGIQAEVITFDSHEAGVEAIASGEIAAYFADQSILLFATRGRDGFSVMNRLLTVEKHGLAMLRGDDEFRYFVDGALSEMFNAGAIGNMYTRALPGIEPGLAMQSLFLVSPILP